MNQETSQVITVYNIRDFGGCEELGRPFEFTVVALGEDPSLEVDSLLGKHATVTLEHRLRAFGLGLIQVLSPMGHP